jgi:hypothetical protein
MDLTTIGITSVILLCYAIGFLLLAKGITDIRYGIGARTWPTTIAHLEGCASNILRSSKGTMYKVSVKYSYTLDGVRHAGDNLAIGYAASSNREAHESAHQKVMSMRRLAIRYHPQKPEISTIFPAENSLIFGTFVFGMLWLFLVTCMTLIVLAISGVGRTMLEVLQS